jgi:aspartyl-tRNA(Asn)/glutamyl-tRNA(Gln) amidotransferase subunit A
LDKLAFLPAVELAKLIRSRQLSSVELMSTILTRIEASQPSLNAFITVCREEAMAAARDADAALAQGKELGPLHGVPVSVKDIINTAGIRTTWGSRTMADNVPTADAIAVHRLKQAGAIILGKTTTSEFAHKLMTDAPLFGTTRNPWDSDTRLADRVVAPRSQWRPDLGPFRWRPMPGTARACPQRAPASSV